MWWQALLAPVTGVIQSLVTGRQRKQELEATLHEKRLEGLQAMDAAEANRLLEQQRGLAGSLKDEYALLVVTIPAIYAFFGEAQAAKVKAGFAALDTMPEWYQYMLVAILLAASGISVTEKAVGSIRRVMGKQ